jgi:hypothetical protein
MAQLTALWAQRQMLACDQAKPLPRSCAAEATRTRCQALQDARIAAGVINRQRVDPFPTCAAVVAYSGTPWMYYGHPGPGTGRRILADLTGSTHPAPAQVRTVT